MFCSWFETSRLRSLCLIGLSVCSFCGCRERAEISTYTALREREALRPFACTIPDGWSLAANDEFSDLAFEHKSGDGIARITISSVIAGGDAALLSNVNRWRRQHMMGPAEDLSSLVDTPIKQGTAKVLRLEYPAKASRIAVVEHNEKLWTFKMTGRPKPVLDQDDQFDAFLKSIEFFDKAKKEEGA